MKIQLVQGDITIMKVDVIVNAANSELKGGGGVDGAIHQAGGAAILRECKQIGYCATGEAVMTNAGKLPAKKVVHTVGPVWHGGVENENHLLGNCYTNSLKLISEKGYSSVAFPNISTGIYGFPKKGAAIIALEKVKDFVDTNPGISVTFVCFDNENFDIYKELMEGAID